MRELNIKENPKTSWLTKLLFVCLKVCLFVYDILPQTHFLNLDFLRQISNAPSPLPHLIIMSHSFNINGTMILLPFFQRYILHTALIWPFPSFKLDILPQHPELTRTPLIIFSFKTHKRYFLRFWMEILTTVCLTPGPWPHPWEEEEVSKFILKIRNFFLMLTISTTTTRWQHLYQTGFQFSRATLKHLKQVLFSLLDCPQKKELILRLFSYEMKAREHGASFMSSCPIFPGLTRGQSNFPTQWAGTLYSELVFFLSHYIGAEQISIKFEEFFF